MILSLSGSKVEIFESLEKNNQVFVETPEECPSPFYRPFVENFADFRFHCFSDGGKLRLSRLSDKDGGLPFPAEPPIVRGSKLYFDSPVFLSDSPSGDPLSEVSYNDSSGLWSFEVPSEIGAKAFLIAPVLGVYSEAYMVSWEDPGDWLSYDTFKTFSGAWGNKGGELAYSHMFDSLGIHGFSIDNGVVLEDVNSSIPYNELLNYVYYKRAGIGQAYLSSQVWWDQHSGSFYIWNGKVDTCFPWVEVDLPASPVISNNPEYVFPTQTEFLASSEELEDGVLVEISNSSTITSAAGIRGITTSLSGSGVIRVWKEEGGLYWNISEVLYPNLAEFEKDSDILPLGVVVRLEDSFGLGSPGGIEVTNLRIIVNREIRSTLIKDHRYDEWKLIASSPLKFVGESRLFSEDANPLDGEIIQTGDRTSIYYYNRWTEVDGEWYLEGDWVDINSGENVDPPSTQVDYTAVVVYCNGQKIVSGESIGSEDFLFSYEVNQDNGNLEFSYRALSSKGKSNLPKIEISDSVTSETRKDISELVFSGARYIVQPNVADSMTPMRVYREKPLLVCGSAEDVERNPGANFLVAGSNTGPAVNSQTISIRMPFNYGRTDSEWHKANLICQSFTFGGTDIGAQRVSPPVPEQRVEIFEEMMLRREDPFRTKYVYSEPYLFSGIDVRKGSYDSPWNNSSLMPGRNKSSGNWKPSRMVPYSPLNKRKTDEEGNWRGMYAQMNRCMFSTGFFRMDMSLGNGQPLEPPVWDYSAYKAPEIQVSPGNWDKDPNNFRVQYALFVAGQSVAGDSVFDLV